MHISCTICTDVVEPDENIHATRCGHVFHNHCLSDWIVRSNTCPQCRRVVTDNCMLRIYPTFSDDKDINSLQPRLHRTLELYKELQIVCVEKEEQLKKATEDLRKNEESLEIYMSELDSRNSAVEVLQQKLETVGIQHTEVQRLKDENASLKDRVRTLNGEIQRQSLLYGEFMAQISLQRNSLDCHSKEAARLRGENAALKKTLRSLNGELRRHKLLYEELRSQVSLQKEQKSNVESQSNLKQSKTMDTFLKNNEDRPKMVLNRASKTELKKIEPPKRPPAQSTDTACIRDKMSVLSQKLNTAKSSHLKLSKTLVNLIVALVKLKVPKTDERGSLITTRQKMYEDDFVTRLSKILAIDDSKSQLEDIRKVAHEKDLGNRQSEISPEMKIPISKLEQTKNSKILAESDIQRMSDFFTDLSKRESQPEKFCKKEDAKRQSVILSPIITEQCRNDFQNAIQRVLVSETLKNYEKNFKSFDIGVFYRKKEEIKSNINRKCVKKVSAEGFELDATRVYGARSVRGEAVFKFSARAVPRPPPAPPRALPPTPAELKKAATNAKKNSASKDKAKPQAVACRGTATQRVTRIARRRIPPPPAFPFTQ